MRNELKQLRELRQKLEEYRPQTGLAKWGQIFGAFRVAGHPRSVSVVIMAVLLSDFIADRQVGEALKAAASEKLKWIKGGAAYKETVWLDQKQLRQFLVRYRENGYRESKVEKWVEKNRDKNPYPYRIQPPAILWKVITGIPVRLKRSNRGS